MAVAGNPVAVAAGAQGLAGATSILFMWALNARYGITFPPEVALSFSTVFGAILHLVCRKIGGCDTDGDGKPDVGVVPQKSEVKP